jgi:hypothetical protein
MYSYWLPYVLCFVELDSKEEEEEEKSITYETNKMHERSMLINRQINILCRR